MAGMKQWVKNTFDAFWDPEKNDRVQNLVSVLHEGIRSQKQRFVLSTALQGSDFTTKDLETAKEELYRNILTRGWSDAKLTVEEQEITVWVAERLQIPRPRAEELNLEFARQHFAVALAEVMDDGVLDTDEELRLVKIAASVGLSLREFTRQFFTNEGQAFLRGVFLAGVADGHISKTEWNSLLAIAQKFGFRHEELLLAIRSQAEQFVEHVLADAKADGRLSPQEDSVLRWLLDNLGLSPQNHEYVRQELGILRAITEIDDGKLPSLPAPPGIEFRAGEIVHFHGSATWRDTRLLKSGVRCEDHAGTFTLTDNRVVFSSPSKSQSISYRKVVSHRGKQNRIEVEIVGKPTSFFFFGTCSRIPYAMFSAVVAMANQTRVAKVEDTPSRHIPRDIRQRVWQRYGGRCVECSATDYLEFDHIIPVAKGGSNSETNVQLLCRRCNLKKLDKI